MSIREGRKRASTKSLRGKYPERYVVPESAIVDFIESLGIDDLDAVVARLQIVADAACYALDSRSEQLDQSVMPVLTALTGESNNKQYQRMMRAIIAGLGDGRDGINAAYLTASRAVGLAFGCASEYFSALDQYKERLRNMRQAGRRQVINYEEARRSTRAFARLGGAF